jgi:hypothetical protein
LLDLTTSHSELSSIVINDREFRHAAVKKTLSGHSQAADSYRTYNQQKCYELRIQVSLAGELEESTVPRRSPPGSLENVSADKRANH